MTCNKRNGTRSESEDSSLNITLLCALLFYGDDMKDEEYMQLALKEAKKAYQKDEVPVGAIVVLNDKIIGKGYNQKERKDDVTSHAELIAIRNASKKIHDWRLNEATLYITLSPCAMCASAIVQSRIKRVVVGALNPDLKNKEIVDLIFDINKEKPTVQITEKVLEKESLELLQSFFKKQRKKGKVK